MIDHINRFHGLSYVFTNGLSIGFNWIHGNGTTSKTSAVIAAYHHPESITWRWAFYWNKPKKLLCWPKLFIWKRRSGEVLVTLPFVGGFAFRWQQHMWRNK